MVLSLEEANRIAQGAMAKAEELNAKISVAVCDAGGRMIGASAHGPRPFGPAYTGARARQSRRHRFGPPQWAS